MKTIVAMIVGVGLLALALWIQTTRLETARADAARAQLDLTNARAVLSAQRDQARRLDQAQADLRRDLGDARTLAAARALENRRLTRENEHLRTWRDQPLPADLIKLLERPVLTGAAGYRKHLSGPDPLSSAGNAPPDER